MTNDVQKIWEAYSISDATELPKVVLHGVRKHFFKEPYGWLELEDEQIHQMAMMALVELLNAPIAYAEREEWVKRIIDQYKNV